MYLSVTILGEGRRVGHHKQIKLTAKFSGVSSFWSPVLRL